MREFMDVGQERQKTYYDRRRYGSSYKVGEEVIVFNPTLKKGQTRKLTSYSRRPYTIVEIKKDSNFKVEEKKGRN